MPAICASLSSAYDFCGAGFTASFGFGVASAAVGVASAAAAVAPGAGHLLAGDYASAS